MTPRHRFSHRLTLPLCGLLIALFCGCSSNQFTVYPAHDSDMPITGGLLYALPRTQVQVCLTVSHYDYSRAPYHEYADQYFAGHPTASEEIRAPYHLQCVQISAVASPDKKQVFYIEPGNNSLYVDSRGILLAVNSTPVYDTLAARFSVGPTLQFYPESGLSATPIVQNHSYRHIDSFYVRTDAPGHPTLGVGKADRMALKEQAEATAAKLIDIEEKQQQLLYGEYEGNYSTESVQFLYSRLEEMKKPYLQLFLGEEKHDSIVCYIEPSEEKEMVDSQTVVLAYFSPTQGLLHNDTLLPADACPIVCTITCDNVLRRVTRASANKIKKQTNRRDQRHCLRYRMPQEALVTISCEGMASVSHRLPIMQYGATTFLPKDNVQATFDSRTGALLHLSRTAQNKPLLHRP